LFIGKLGYVYGGNPNYSLYGIYNPDIESRGGALLSGANPNCSLVGI
jgi:hypothetical protein